MKSNQVRSGLGELDIHYVTDDNPIAKSNDSARICGDFIRLRHWKD